MNEYPCIRPVVFARRNFIYFCVCCLGGCMYIETHDCGNILTNQRTSAKNQTPFSCHSWQSGVAS